MATITTTAAVLMQAAFFGRSLILVLLCPTESPRQRARRMRRRGHSFRAIGRRVGTTSTAVHRPSLVFIHDPPRPRPRPRR